MEGKAPISEPCPPSLLEQTPRNLPAPCLHKTRGGRRRTWRGHYAATHGMLSDPAAGVERRAGPSVAVSRGDRPGHRSAIKR